jgi:transposase InsO family protein
MDGRPRSIRGQRDKRDLLRRNFSAAAPSQKRCGDITEIPTDEGKLYLA